MPNKKGGKKYKKKKQFNYDTKETRLKEKDQEYAQIKNCNGNCRFDVLCFDGKQRMAIMCGSMRKRKFVNVHDIVLVSIREWQDNVCDIIDNYNNNDIKKLKKIKHIPENIKTSENNIEDEEIMDDNNGFKFSYDIPNESESNSDIESDIDSEDESEGESEDEKIDLNNI
jgi:translation initiation factor 1A